MDRKILEPHHAVEKRDLYRSVLPRSIPLTVLVFSAILRVVSEGQVATFSPLACGVPRMIGLCALCFALSVQDPPPYSVQHAQELETMEMTFTSSASAGGCCLLTLLDKSTVDVRKFENICGNHM